MTGFAQQRLRAVLRALGSPALAFALLLLPLGLLPAGIVALRVALAVWYGGGVEAFDRHYEQQVAERIGRAETRADAFERLVAAWRPQPRWQRELLHTDAVPQDLCNAEYGESDDGREVFAVFCAAIERYAADAAALRERRDLADDARDRALWITARALRMSAAWLSELPVIVVHQQQRFAAGDVAVYLSAFEPDGRTLVLDALLAKLDERVKVIENSAQGRQLPIAFQ